MKDLHVMMLKGKPGGEEPPPATEGDDSSKGRLMAAQDIIAAVKSGDAKALDAALEDHYAMCQAPTEDAGY